MARAACPVKCEAYLTGGVPIVFSSPKAIGFGKFLLETDQKKYPVNPVNPVKENLFKIDQ